MKPPQIKRGMGVDAYLYEIERRALLLRGLLDGQPLKVRQLVSTIANLAHAAPRRSRKNRKSKIDIRKSERTPCHNRT
jgi:hypothetical protein